VVVRVDQARQQDVPAGVEGLIARSGRLPAGGHELGDSSFADHQPAAGVEAVRGERGEGILDPKPGRGRGAGCGSSGGSRDSGRDIGHEGLLWLFAEC